MFISTSLTYNMHTTIVAIEKKHGLFITNSLTNNKHNTIVASMRKRPNNAKLGTSEINTA